MQSHKSDPSSGLVLNFLRNKYSTFILDSFSKDLISKSEGLILLGSLITFTDDEANFIYNGGLIILRCVVPYAPETPNIMQPSLSI